MTRDLEYNITAQDNGVTISDYLKKQGFSHAVTVQLKKIPESILLNGNIWVQGLTAAIVFPSISRKRMAQKTLLQQTSRSPSVMKMRTF